MTDKLISRWTTISVILLLAAAALYLNWPLNLGIDLRGGTVITYRIDRESIEELRDAGESFDDARQQTVRVMSERINSLGLKDVNVREAGPERIQVTAAATTRQEQAEINATITQLGDLKFLMGIGDLREEGRVERFDVRHPETGALIKVPFNESEADAQRQQAIERDKGKTGEEVYRDGMPYALKHEEGWDLPFVWYVWNPGQLARREGGDPDEYRAALQSALIGEDYDEEKVKGAWLYFDPRFWGPDLPGFTGRDISNVRPGLDEVGARAVNYTVNVDRQAEFADYTGAYVDKPMVIVLNNEVWSVANIRQALRDDVQIEGGAGGFSQEDQDWLVTCLRSGSLKLRPILESQENVGAALGDSAVAKGELATLVGLLIVIAFIITYYRVGGVVATVALVTNLFLLVAVLALFRATITLPGIAGVILTIGMSVDANILVFERVREELGKGKTLVASMQAGYARAFVTIIDANLTTLITAIFLYQYGVGPIKGFAVTLMAGIICSLFTAVYVTKSIYGFLLKRNLLKDFRMRRWIPADTRVDFVGKRRVAAICSVAVVALAITLFEVTPNDKLYGLDFTGGTVVRVNLADDTFLTTDEMAAAVSGIRDAEGRPKYGQVEVIGVLTGEDSRRGNSFNTFDVQLQSKTRLDGAEVAHLVTRGLETALGANFDSADDEARQAERGEAWTLEFTTKQRMGHLDLRSTLDGFRDVRGRAVFRGAEVTALDGEADPELEQEVATRWQIVVSPTTFSSEELLGDLRSSLGDQLYEEDPASEKQTFPKLSYVGPNVVADLKMSAIISIVLSLLATILYIWFRFKEFKYGFAAAMAVFHDVTVVLGFVVLANLMGIVHVPIELAIIGAFLTIIGYSLNDTIVLFDRVRENIGNIKGSYSQIINTSINQTLGRTLLTSVTTFLVVLVLFVFNYGERSVLEGFAFTLMLGIIVGTYSSIFIASPLVILLQKREQSKKEDARARA